MRKEHLAFALPDTDEDDCNEVTQVIQGGWLTTGPKTHRFESEFAAAVGARHGIAVNSCTAAMHLALEAVKVARGDEVITTPYTFAATAEVIRYFDARPVLVDICSHDFNLDPKQLEAAITPRTRAVIPVHISGLPAEMDAILDIARRHGLAVVEDAAHAFPTSYRGRMVGSLGDVTCFSFYATKTITTGEGGMICTDNKEIADRCHVMSLHGISKDAWKRYTAEGSWYYEIIAPGFKYNMTDVAAAMGLAQLRKAERMAQRRTEIARRFNVAFSEFPELQTPFDRADCRHAWQLYMLRLNLEMLSISRAQFVEELKARNIGASVHFIPLHVQPYYRETYGYKPEDYPVAYREYRREISLPIYSRMSDQDVHDVIDAVADTVTAYRR